jgi:3-phosphoshikimate 1-carboxyvinyltransferase
VRVDDDGRGRAPFTVHGTGRVRGGAVTVDASESSQIVSGLLLAAARFTDGIDLALAGGVPSLPHVEMTVAALGEHGVDVSATDRGWRVAPGPVAAHDRVVEPDLSNAAPFLAAALVTGGRVTVPDWPAATTQPGAQLDRLLTGMGADVELTAGGLRVTGTGRIAPLVADLGDVGELTPVLAALCALAEGPSRLTGIGHLRGHETDRLQALDEVLTAVGARVEQLPDGLVSRRPPGPPRWSLLRRPPDGARRRGPRLAVDGVRVSRPGGGEPRRCRTSASGGPHARRGRAAVSAPARDGWRRRGRRPVRPGRPGSARTRTRPATATRSRAGGRRRPGADDRAGRRAPGVARGGHRDARPGARPARRRRRGPGAAGR